MYKYKDLYVRVLLRLSTCTERSVQYGFLGPTYRPLRLPDQARKCLYRDAHLSYISLLLEFVIINLSPQNRCLPFLH